MVYRIRLEKYLKKQLFDMKNYELMRRIRDQLFKFKSEIHWFEPQYLENIANKRNSDISQNKQPKTDIEYFTNGKNLFSILATEYVNNGGTQAEFRKHLCELVISYNDYSNFEEKLSTSLNQIFY